MRTRIIRAAGVVSILAVACSAPDEPPAVQTQAEARDLALMPPEAEEAVASELEAPRPEPQRNGSPRPAVRRPSSPAPIGNPIATAPAPVADAEAPGTTDAVHPRVDETVEAPVSGPYAGEATGGKPRIPMTGERVPDPGPGAVGVIIRGGDGRDGDDCARHRPPEVGDVRPPSGTGVLINERAPRRLPPQIADRTPSHGPQMGRSGGIR